jgi:hypothetical protein
MKTKLGLVARIIHIGTSVRSATAQDSRSEDEAMLIHCENERRRRPGRSARTQRAGGGCGRYRRCDSSMKEHRLLIAPRSRHTSPACAGTNTGH